MQLFFISFTYFPHIGRVTATAGFKLTHPCQLSLWEETGAPGENPRLSVER